ncbi:hypothetical protein KCP71_20560 [Salmonella enterica subsp. enterica]|nr:hypothetical protein KCP71_20560 [Salmonella enterica subsp. enterica]
MLLSARQNLAGWAPLPKGWHYARGFLAVRRTANLFDGYPTCWQREAGWRCWINSTPKAEGDAVLRRGVAFSKIGKGDEERNVARYRTP